MRVAPGLLGKGSRLRPLGLWAMGLAGFVAVVLVALHFGSLQKMLELARSARPGWLLVAFVAQGATYLSAAFVWRQALQCAGHPLPLRALVPLGIAKVFTDQVLPSGGISGTMLVVRGLIRRRVPAGIAMAAMLAGLVSYDGAYLIVVLASASALWIRHRMNLPLVIGVAIFVVVTIAVPAAVLGLKRWGQRKPIAWVSKCLGGTDLLQELTDAPTELLRSPWLLMQTVALQLAIFLLDAMTLWLAFKALGEVPALWVVFVSFAIASMVATIGPIPVGLGTFEATSVGMLSLLGVSIEAALAGTLLLRGLTFWLPMLPGLWLARRELSRASGAPAVVSAPR
ncbi:lysylphosphatidylglycerol synthase transmembrane domain-containing protein [Paraburkholderia aromaticivorans]|uniref:lysylphosphatidylglycerol synthase transmembrane domain-containing protein n=1 Tax=Paraburkholderia aromaticivorans TaxID=2026199 RepID=UPI001F0E8632|nr:lysylphosphatidylglycerol synthase transmembrane domain-containing protein [Paraburkholderia aromaticivorans]